MRPYNLATVVFPVPGFPRNTLFSDSCWGFSSLSSLSLFVSTTRRRSSTLALTLLETLHGSKSLERFGLGHVQGSIS